MDVSDVSDLKDKDNLMKDVMMTYPWGEREPLSCLNLCLNVRGKKRNDRESEGDVVLSIALQIVLRDERDKQIKR